MDNLVGDKQTVLSLGLNLDDDDDDDDNDRIIRSNASIDHHQQRRWPEDHASFTLERSSSNTVFLETSLTLGPSSDQNLPKAKHDYGRTTAVFAGVVLERQLSSHSTGSSFFGGTRPRSGIIIKREIEAAGSISNDDDDEEEEEEEGNTRKKLRLNKEQSALLEDKFKEQSTLNPKQKLALAEQLNLRARQVEVWFQNRRARSKLKQTKVDCEYLRKCCETLTNENQRLQKELQELKMLKLSSTLGRVRLPAGAIFTVCPSCERISTPATNSSTATAGGPAASTAVASATAAKAKPHFLNPFAPSAKC